MIVVTLAALAWAIYHAGIEKGRKRAAGQEMKTWVARIREWR